MSDKSFSYDKPLSDEEIESIILELDYQKTSLIPAVIQDHQSLEVLMLGFVNQEALKLSLKTGYMHYFSRSKSRIWKKGETSGHVQKIVNIKIDCDRDSLLVNVIQEGSACHTNHKSCFFRDLGSNFSHYSEIELPDKKSIDKILDHLFHILLERKMSDPQKSYTASLYQKGVNAISKKIAEESAELICEFKDSEHLTHQRDMISQKIVYESADLLFHLLVGFAYYNIHPERIFSELARRFGVSGITEKAQRK